MLSSNNKEMLNVIEKYNADKTPKDQIKFMHGGSSLRLAIAGKNVAFQNYKERKIVRTTIPAAIFPDGLLRKKYGIHPLSGSRKFGTFANRSRKKAVNYNNISGMGVTAEGVSTVSKYAKDYGLSKQSLSIPEEILRQLATISPKDNYYDNFIVHLKKLVMLITNLWITDPDTAKKNASDYINLLENEYKNIMMQDERPEIEQYFNKYISRIEDILQGKAVAFERDDKFTKELQNQYPIIFCSTVRSYDRVDEYTQLGEQIYQGELPLNTVKIMFTLPEYVETLQAKMHELGLLDVQVYGMLEKACDVKKNDDQKIDAAFSDFMKTNNLDELMKQSGKISLSTKIYAQKITSCLEKYLSEDKGEEHFKMAWWLIKHTKDFGVVHEWGPWVVFDSLRCIINPWYHTNEASSFINLIKIAVDPNYLRTVSQFSHINLNKLQKLQKISSFIHSLEYMSSNIDLFNLNNSDPGHIPNSAKIDEVLGEIVDYHDNYKSRSFIEETEIVYHRIFQILKVTHQYCPEDSQYINACIENIRRRTELLNNNSQLTKNTLREIQEYQIQEKVEMDKIKFNQNLFFKMKEALPDLGSEAQDIVVSYLTYS